MNSTDCFSNLVGLRDLCTSGTAPNFYLDDIEGITQKTLSDLANEMQGSGKKMASQIIDSAIRIMRADIDTIIPSNYRMTQELVNLCSSCSYSGFFTNASALGSGIIVKNITGSKFSKMFMSSLLVMVNSTGSFDLLIDDGNPDNLQTITYDFVAGQQTTFKISYQSTASKVKIYFNNPAVSLSQILCPKNSTCGCGSNSAAAVKDILIVGYSGGVENSQQYAILPCVMVACNYDAIICQLITTSPNLFSSALLCLVASKIFNQDVKSQRVNRTASFDKDDKKTDSELYYERYQNLLRGKPAKGILGITQAVNDNLARLKDKCITCSGNPIGVAWAGG